MPTLKKDTKPITIPVVQREPVQVFVIGTNGLIINRMSAKARHTLMLGGSRKTTAEKAEIKHHPYDEFIDSMDFEEGFDPHSHVKFPAAAFKQAMGTAALYVEKITKTDVKRLVWLPRDFVPVYGIPKLRMDIVRNAGPGRTPDVRTRAYFKEWAVPLVMEFVRPQLSQTAIVTLLANAGRVAGVGDYRQEHGTGSFGTFRVLEGGMAAIPEHLLDAKAQLKAIKTPQPANPETAALLAEYDAEHRRRQQ